MNTIWSAYPVHYLVRNVDEQTIKITISIPLVTMTTCCTSFLFFAENDVMATLFSIPSLCSIGKILCTPAHVHTNAPLTYVQTQTHVHTQTQTHTNDAMRLELQSVFFELTEDDNDVNGGSFSSSESGNNSFNKSPLCCFLLNTCSGAGLCDQNEA